MADRDREREKQEMDAFKEKIKEDKTFILKTLKMIFFCVRFNFWTSILLIFGLLSIPGAIMAGISGGFFNNRLEANAPLPERVVNSLAADIGRPVVGTVLVSSEAAYRANYQPVSNPSNKRPTGTLSAQDMRKLEQFANSTNATLVRFNNNQ